MSAIVDEAREKLIRDLQQRCEGLRRDLEARTRAHESAEQDVRRLHAECERSVEQLNKERNLRLRTEAAMQKQKERADLAEKVAFEGVHAQALQLLAEAQLLVEALRRVQAK